MNDSDRDLWKKLFSANYRYNQLQFKQLAESDGRLAERIDDVENIIISHSKRSRSFNAHLYLLMGGVFVCFFLLGLSIDGQIAGSKITYSASKLTQIILQVFSAGGVAVAIASNPRIKQIFKK